ncbi:Ig-like domain-containing protein [Curtobacterium sp. DN_7.5]|uniref:Ig-like domain-containing protein n=1 Tax=Curtobacterium sp. DN_7.5 TaxID=3049047 RepID=UPI001F588A71|nr:Ig-like domain-containing protein [Curtobacterium sp. DN_7.5]
MPHKPKRVMTRLGASALAAVTIASGLSFGTAATAAPAENTADSPAASSTAQPRAGEQTLDATQRSKGGNSTSTSVTVTPGDGESVQPVSVNAAFDASDGFAPAVVSGRGEPGATVRVVNTSKNSVSVGTASVGPDGQYRMSVAASAAQYGVNRFTATQSVDGSSTTATATLDYGAEPTAPRFQTPTAGGTIDPGTIAFAGSGQADAKLIVRGTNTTVAPLVTTTVDAQGRWSGDSIRELRGLEYRIFAIQTVKGGLQKQSDVTFTVRATASQGLTLGAAFDEVDEFAPAVLTGRGVPRATVRVVNSSKGDAAVGTATVGADGQYRLTVAPSAAKYGVNTFTATQDAAGKTTTATTSLDYGTAPTAVRITTPTQGSVLPPSTPTFSGTGAPQAKITVRGTNTTVAPLVTATVGANGRWSGTAVRALDKAQAYKLWGFQTTKGGLVTETDVTFTIRTGATR